MNGLFMIEERGMSSCAIKLFDRAFEADDMFKVRYERLHTCDLVAS